jgi:hypothetical protein
MLEDKRKEFKGTDNVWIKRAGLLIVIAAFCPNFVSENVLGARCL